MTRPGLKQARAAAGLVIALGVTLFLAGLAELWVGTKAENVSDLVRPEMTDAGLAQHRHDFEAARDGLTGFREEVLPAIAQNLGVRPAPLEEAIRADHPAVSKLFDEQAAIVPFAEQSLENLERQQSAFEEADSLPVSGLPGYSGGVANLASALLLMVCGGWLLRAGVRPSRWPFAVIGAVCAVMIIVPLALRLPQKADSAETVLDSLNPSRQVVQRTEDAIETTRAGVEELRARVIPDLAAALGITEAEFARGVAGESPATARAFDEMPDILDRYEARLAIRQGGAADLRTLKDIPVGLMGWFDSIFGVVLGVALGWLWVSRGSGGSVIEEAGPDDQSDTVA